MPHRRIVLTLPLLLSAVLSACAVGPDYAKPELKLRDSYVAAPATHGTPPHELREWWKHFNDPLLAEFVSEALQQSLDIDQALARLSQSRAGLKAATAALLPSGAVSAQAARANLSTETPQGRLLSATPGFNRNGNFYEADTTIAWEIDLFGGARRGREAASATLQSSIASVDAVRLAVAAQTADTYLTIRGLQARLAIAEGQVKTRARLADLVKLQQAKGLAADLQVHQVEAALAQAQATLPVLRAGLDAAMNALDVALGVPPGTHRDRLTQPGTLPEAPALPSLGSPADLLRRRPDLVAAERNLAAANARIGAAIADYYPKLSFAALLGTATTSSAHLLESPASQASAFLGLRWRLFDFGRVDAEVTTARGQASVALAAYRLAALRASEDVENALSEQFNRSEQARILARGEVSLSMARQAAEAAYKSGVVSLIEVLDADDRLLATQDARAQAQTSSARAAVASFKALGGGWNAPEAEPVKATSDRA